MTSLAVADDCCYHCLLAVPKHTAFSVIIEGHSRAMCCPGCAAVAQTIIDSGLTNYYQHRSLENLNNTGLSRDQGSLIPQELSLYNSDTLQQQFVTAVDEGTKQATLVIEGITCAACIWLLEHHITKQSGVTNFSVNMTNHRAQLHWQPEHIQLGDILEKIHHIGYRGHPYRADLEEQLLATENKRTLRRLGVAGVGMMQILALAVSLYFGEYSGIDQGIRSWLRWISFIICIPIAFYAAQPFFVAAIRDLKTRHLSMDVPVSIAIAAAFSASSWATFTDRGEIYFDSVAMFTFFLLFGRYLEMQARHRTGRAGNALQNLLPEAAIKLEASDNQPFVKTLVAVNDLAVGDRILVKPGQTIPADGIIVQGYSSIDESALTGEYLPKRRVFNEQVVGGTLNVENPLHIEITKIGAQTQLSAIIRLLERASEEKPRVAKLADKIANYFVAFVLIGAAVVSITWWYLDPQKAFWITLSVLVVTCPCALSLATPTALTTATGTLRELGLLITRSHVLENLSCATDFVFDKTGTLTQGNLCISKISGTLDEKSALQIAAALEAHSEHPIARAFAPYTTTSADHIEVTIGQGIQGTIEGHAYRIGKASFAAKILEDANISCRAPDEDGHWLLLCNTQKIIAWFSIADALRADSEFCITALQQLDINVHMLTGDSSSSAELMANQLNIVNLEKGASPEDKINYINNLRDNGAEVVMVGDGINDLPVLAGAQTSLAMGSASDLAKTHADAVLINGELTVIIQALLIAKKTRRIIKQNIFWAFSYNMTTLPLAAFGMIPPYAAAIGMSLSSVVVVTNALRLSKKTHLSTQQLKSTLSGQSRQHTLIPTVDV